ncbi:DUF1349 domain-containing protein [Luteococcus sp. OSA5]|uniref:DUF1349 domain-containing protein n=1 Tax=Luteococcus sp. OSA5 TaxID=3401630 RepID=UPI003B435955
MTRNEWSTGTWTHEPASVSADPDGLLVTCVEGSDAWRHTSYGFVHESEHALVAPLEPGSAVEVVFLADFSQQFDQAGVYLCWDSEHWIKAGCEFADGRLQVGAVVTDGHSDWSVRPVDWLGQRVRVRASWSDGAVTIRAGLDGEALELVRVAPFDAQAPVSAGPFTCAPTRAGLTTRFTSWEVLPADVSLHP